ncbi:MAG: tRNA glutamyl-Q(34) synthetase GluQRS [Planctomycetales bacterium]|nr:tRNA glutamyl-Q(34) synthetase GluQRS [Planctomycetales bacterium]
MANRVPTVETSTNLQPPIKLHGNMAVGRLAPSPTGALHIGNARTFLLAWLSIRAQGGRVILRIEDIDSPRIKPWAIEQTIDDLRWLGLDWDFGPPNSGQLHSKAFPLSLIQTNRRERFCEIFETLKLKEKVYVCTCSRSEVAAAATAPHEYLNLEGPIYPGTCRDRYLDADEINGSFAWRWKLDEIDLSWKDQFLGQQQAKPAEQLGDFVIAKADGTPSYQLAVTVDDHDMQVTEVLRGDDLVFSTFRQLSIMNFLGWRPPNYMHVPLMIGNDGRRLAKRHGDTRLAHLRERGVTPEAIVGYLAWTLHQVPHPHPTTARQLVGQLDWTRMPHEPTVFEPTIEIPNLLRMSSR